MLQKPAAYGSTRYIVTVDYAPDSLEMEMTMGGMAIQCLAAHVRIVSDYFGMSVAFPNGRGSVLAFDMCTPVQAEHMKAFGDMMQDIEGTIVRMDVNV